MQLPPSGPPREPDAGTDAGNDAEAGTDAEAGADTGADVVRAAYAERAGEYAAVLGSMSAVHPDDLDLVTRWARALDGPVLDLGCGPGHWTAYLAGHDADGRRRDAAGLDGAGHDADGRGRDVAGPQRDAAGRGLTDGGRAAPEHVGRGGLDVTGVDPVPAFVEHARRTHPGVRYEVGSAEHLPTADCSVGGVLAWYSLVHHSPAAVDEPLREIARVLRPGGRLLVGFFEAPTLEPFDHAVVTAWPWPVTELAARLEAAGLTVLESTTRTDPGSRPHAALVAERRPRD